MLTIHTGHNYLLSNRLCEIIASIPSESDVYIIVPRQLTLLTEQTIMKSLGSEGTFRVQVYNSTRICDRIFNEAGYPNGDHIDERGRVMLCRRAAHDVRDDLSIYRDAEKRTGFAAKCAAQLEKLIQGGISSQQVLEVSSLAKGTDARKLHDLALIFERYTELTEGIYQDTETELIDATSRVENAPFLRDTYFCFYGFSIVPPLLTEFISAIASVSPAVHVLLPIKNDVNDTDYDCYLPIEKTLNRLTDSCKERAVAFERVEITETSEKDAVRALSSALFSISPIAFNDDHSNIHCFTAPTIIEECRRVAAIARHLSRSQGIRYSQMQILCSDPEAYRLSLKEAFERYEIPLMSDTGRPVSRVGAAELLLLAIRSIIDGYRMHDVISVARTGFCGISRREVDQLENYATSNGIEGARWCRPFVCRGKDDKVPFEEKYRSRLITPIEKLHAGLTSAKSLKQQLTALFNYISSTDVDALNCSRRLCKKLSDAGKNEEAGLISQSWNRLISTLDMMNELLGEERLSMVELYQTLSNALDVSIIKILPQSADSVHLQSAGSMLYQHASVIFVMGLCDRSSGTVDDLLLPAQRKLITEHTGAYLGPTEDDLPLQRRYYIKESINMAADSVYFSCAMVDFEGSSHKRGEELKTLPLVFPGFSDMDEALLNRYELESFESAFDHTSHSFGPDSTEIDLLAKGSVQELAANNDQIAQRLQQLDRLAAGIKCDESISPEHATDIYRKISKVSITQLECFAKCPYKHFIEYGLHPNLIKPYDISSADTGTFLHGCLHEFFENYKDSLNTISPPEASELMRKVADRYLSGLADASYKIEDSPVSRRKYEDLIQRACNCAYAIASHMNGSRFHVTDSEFPFDSEQNQQLIPGTQSSLVGSVDRIDSWPDGERTRVIDFKSSKHTLEPASLLDGTALQLAIYTGIAEKARNYSCAGMYYFTLGDGFITSESRNEIELEKERGKEMQMTGLLPADKDILLAQAPVPENVFGVKINKDGSYPKKTAVATDEDFDRIVAHSQKKAAEHLNSIMTGTAQILPQESKSSDACKYCNNRPTCLFDPSLNTKRKQGSLSWEELFKRIITDD